MEISLNNCFFILQPKRMVSPATVLKRQKGNSFEMSTLLCSLLLGAGYDAYVVCGYATREVTQCDETRDVCPLLKKKDEVRKKRSQHRNEKLLHSTMLCEGMTTNIDIMKAI